MFEKLERDSKQINYNYYITLYTRFDSLGTCDVAEATLKPAADAT